MSRALGFGKGDLNPHNFLYPTLYFYVLFACEGLYFLGGRLLGAIASRAAFQQSVLRRSHRHLPGGPRARRRLRPADRLGDVAVRPTARRPGCRRGRRLVSRRRAVCRARRALREARRAGDAAHHARRDGSLRSRRERASRARPATIPRSRDGGARDVAALLRGVRGPAAHGGRLARVGRFVSARADGCDGSRGGRRSDRVLPRIALPAGGAAHRLERYPRKPADRHRSRRGHRRACLRERTRVRPHAVAGRCGLARHPAGAGRPRRAGASQAVCLPADTPLPDRVPGFHQHHDRRHALSQPGAALRRTAGGRRGRPGLGAVPVASRMGCRRDSDGGGRRPRLCCELAYGHVLSADRHTDPGPGLFPRLGALGDRACWCSRTRCRFRSRDSRSWTR